MDIIASNQAFVIKKLSRTLAEKYVRDIIIALDQIPLTEKHAVEKILADKKAKGYYMQSGNIA